eukprot:TRINITY_DN10214_c0_g2_i4.p1 TRINITY_DN10214_c0_g2~~TRINITY_DN10214_c0_g2_i4.p1  ORF type:complete len:415 (+),score=117.21 TRINITY_DN10214_c0_g2_i4:831-2075(+)
MPKKKTKKGKGKKKSKKGKVAKPKLSQMERFIQFSVSTRVDQTNLLRQRRDELIDENVEIKKSIADKRQQQLKKYQELRKLASNQSSELEGLESRLADQVQAALADKTAHLRDFENNIAKLKEDVNYFDSEIAKAQRQLHALKVYKAVGQQDMAKQIAVMKATIDDMLQEHEYNMEQERLQFEHAKDRFSRTFEARLLRTKHRATEDAIANQGSRQQANQIDQLWLKRELELHQAAQSELEGSCLELETCNLRLLAQLHGTAAEERFTTLEGYKEASEARRGWGHDSSSSGSEEDSSASDYASDEDGTDNGSDMSRRTRGSVGWWRLNDMGQPVLERKVVSEQSLRRKEAARRLSELPTMSAVTMESITTLQGTASPRRSNLVNVINSTRRLSFIDEASRPKGLNSTLPQLSAR